MFNQNTMTIYYCQLSRWVVSSGESKYNIYELYNQNINIKFVNSSVVYIIFCCFSANRKPIVAFLFELFQVMYLQTMRHVSGVTRPLLRWL